MTKVVRVRAKRKNKRVEGLVDICVYLAGGVVVVVGAPASVNIEKVVVILGNIGKICNR
jgi:hypothetical protein